jgi:hypothetical protein
MRLLQTHKIVFTRHGSDSDKTYVDEYGDTISPSETSEIVTCGSLQPFSKKNNRVGLPEGFREEDFYVYYTKSSLRTTNQFQNEIPDTCSIEGREYKVTTKGNWTGFGLSVDNYEYYLQLIQPKGS